MDKSQKNYDVIIVGSGIGGLTAGVELASQGAKVLVLEQHYLLGGACTTYPRKGGFLFDAGVESISGLGKRGPVNHFLSRHGLMEQLTWIRNRYAFHYQGKYYSIPMQWETWRDELMEQYPANAKGIYGFFTTCRGAFEEQYRSFDSNRVTPLVPQTFFQYMKFPFQCPNFFKWMKRTWGELLDTYIYVPEVRAQLSMLTGYVGDAGDNTPAKIMFSIMGYFIDGGYRPQGGSGELAKVIVEKLRKYGGEVKSRVDVTEILIEDGKVIGVKTKKEEEYLAPVVISNVDPRVTFEKMIHKDYLPASFLEKVNHLQPSMSLYVWTAALSRPFITDEMVHVKLAEPIHLPLNQVTIHSYTYQSSAAIDPTLAPHGQGNLIVNFKGEPKAEWYQDMEEEGYEKCKEEIDIFCRSIVAQLNSEIASSILFSEVATSKTVQHFMRTFSGSIYSTKIDQQAPFPTSETPIKGLYLAGAGVGYGPGIEAVVITGAEVAEKVARGLFDLAKS